MKWKGKLKARTKSVSNLKDFEISELFNLFTKYYTSTEKDIFESDLKRKSKIILLFNQQKKICGFSTLTTFKVTLNNKTIKCIFSGDTVIDQQYWGTSALTLEFLKNIMLERLKNPFIELWWFLISKGYKTYLLMANNFHEYYPRYDQITPPKNLSIISHFAETLYPGVLNKELGILEFKENHDRLKETVAPITQSMCERNPKIDFFQKSNPDWKLGNELACIGKVSFKLGLSHPIKVLKKKFNRNNKRIVHA